MIKVELFEIKKIINFYMPSSLLGQNGFALKTKKDGRADNLLDKIMCIKGVKRCLICDDLVSVQYEENADEIRLPVLLELDDFLQADSKLLAATTDVADLIAVEALADAMIRPTLFRDNGDLEVVSLLDGVLKIRFLGHCAGCPYAENTLQNVVAKTIQRFIPQIKQVIPEESR